MRFLKFALFVVVAGCGGTSAPGATTSSVDQKGGTLGLGAMIVDIPAGALPGQVAFTMTSAEDSGAIPGMAYVLAGDVPSFALPTRVTFSVPTSLGLPPDELFVATYENGGWLALGDAEHRAAEHDPAHADPTHPPHGASHDPAHDAPHDHVSGSAHGPGHFGVIHCPHGACPHS